MCILGAPDEERGPTDLRPELPLVERDEPGVYADKAIQRWTRRGGHTYFHVLAP
jgi:hypothetical protein